MDPAHRARLTEILNQHDAAVRALRASSDAFDQLMVDAAVTATHTANEAARAAIDALLTANREVLALFNDEPDTTVGG